MSEKVLITGCAGFIGFHTAKAMLSAGYEVVGIDNLNDYYSVQLKRDRLQILESHPDFSFYKVDIANTILLTDTLKPHRFDYVVHLAAQAGVRYSIDNPQAYGRSNLIGFLNILEWIRHNPVTHFIYASSSSVYGNSQSVPFSVDSTADKPISLYAATKRANELMTESYSHLYSIPATGLRFFTVYGPYGRPDMAPMKFAKKIMQNEQIDVFNHGDLARDFTYIDDIVEGVIRLLKKPATSEKTGTFHQLFNIGRGQPVNLLEFIQILESNLGKTAKKRYLPMQDGDVKQTWADVSSFEALTGYAPRIDIQRGIKIFSEWYKNYYAHRESA